MSKFESFDIRNEDFEPVLRSLPAGAFVYLDPTYFEQGGKLYKHSMGEADHERLAALLRESPCRWVLSYDDHPRVRDLYSWADIRSFSMTPSVPRSPREGFGPAVRRRNKTEIVIRNRNW